ncbi:hypothetical protein M9H77_18635 [Catharanthus roseus]|uniref:Uncharacterized protein n=1 Tax=Catharanthus roseus TaxID=4058 RepID=A0ACC0B854_CATRO|nr:hypothetical protein M9H77_18635 [Catharanthus roseus]
MPCLKDKPVSNSSPSFPTLGSIPVEVEITSEPSLEPSQEPKTNEELVTPSSDIPNPPSVLETRETELEESRDRVRRVPKEHSGYGYSYVVSYAFAIASYVEDKEPLCFSDVLKNPNRSLWLRAVIPPTLPLGQLRLSRVSACLSTLNYKSKKKQKHNPLGNT